MDYFNWHRHHTASDGVAPAVAEEKLDSLSGFIRPLQMEQALGLSNLRSQLEHHDSHNTASGKTGTIH
jgi:hypothetical protein